MHKTERDQMLTRLSEAERRRFWGIIQEARVQGDTAGGQRVTARQVFASQDDTLPLPIRHALAAVAARDDMGPQVGERPPDFSLKRLGSDERVRLSSFQGQRPVALVFGIYT